MLGFYVHIPFCKKICHYCNFVITTSGVRPKEELFLELFEKEAAYYSKKLRGRKFDTLYIGGGTPSALTEKDLAKVFGSLRRYFKFRGGAEVTIETNPGDITPEKARLLKALGVTRVSLGAQTFHDRTLKKLNRAHDARAIGDSFRALRGAGFDNISADLMLSLPGETAADVKVSLEKLLALRPEHVSLYELVVEEGTVFGRRRKSGRLVLPAEEEELAMLALARGRLKGAGYRHYELLNYARPGRESRHNLLYWENREYLGLGPGAFSYLDGRRFRNSASVDEYLKKTAAGDWSAHEEEVLGEEARRTESFLLALRREEGASLKKFAKTAEMMDDAVQKLAAQGLVEKKSGNIRLTERGKLFAETVFSELSTV